MTNINLSNTEKLGKHILRLSLAITYLWVGLMIIQNPENWSGFLPKFILTSEYSTQITLAAGFFDSIIGLFLVANRWVWFISFLAGLHLLGILIVNGVNALTVRDIGLLGGLVALFLFNIPHNIKRKFITKQKGEVKTDSSNSS